MSSLFSSLKRQQNLCSRTPSKPSSSTGRSIFSAKSRKHRPVLSDLCEVDEDGLNSVSPSPSPLPSPRFATSSTPHLTEAHTLRTSRSQKRLSRYGKADFEVQEQDDGVFTAPRPAPLPPTESPFDSLLVRVSPMNSPVSLSAFAFDDAPPSVSSPIPSPTLSQRSRTPITPVRSHIRVTHSPTPSVSSGNATDYTDSSSPSNSSGHMPNTPTTSDDEHFPTAVPCQLFSGAKVVPRSVSIHPLVINKSAPSLPLAAVECQCEDDFDDLLDAYEFTFASSPVSPSMDDNKDEYSDSDSPVSDTDSYLSDDGLFYTLAHSNYAAGASLPSLTSPVASSPSRPESVPPTPRRALCSPVFRRSSASSLRRMRRSSLSRAPSACSFVIPSRGPVPSSQLDPSYPRRRPSKPTRPPPPVPALPSRPATPSSQRQTLRNRKSLSIVVVPRRGSQDSTSSSTSTESKRPPPRESLPSDVLEIIDDIDNWDFELYDDASREDGKELKSSVSANDVTGQGLRQDSFRLPVPKTSPLALDFSEVEVTLSSPPSHCASSSSVSSSLPTSASASACGSSSASSFDAPFFHTPPNERGAYFSPTSSSYAASPLPSADQDEPEAESGDQWDDEHVLRSRWSSSTLSTIAANEGSMSALIKSHFNFSRKRRGFKTTAPVSTAPSVVDEVMRGGLKLGESPQKSVVVVNDENTTMATTKKARRMGMGRLSMDSVASGRSAEARIAG